MFLSEPLVLCKVVHQKDYWSQAQTLKQREDTETCTKQTVFKHCCWLVLEEEMLMCVSDEKGIFLFKFKIWKVFYSQKKGKKVSFNALIWTEITSSTFTFWHGKNAASLTIWETLSFGLSFFDKTSRLVGSRSQRSFTLNMQMTSFLFYPDRARNSHRKHQSSAKSTWHS